MCVYDFEPSLEAPLPQPVSPGVRYLHGWVLLSVVGTQGSQFDSDAQPCAQRFSFMWMEQILAITQWCLQWLL